MLGDNVMKKKTKENKKKNNWYKPINIIIKKNELAKYIKATARSGAGACQPEYR